MLKNVHSWIHQQQITISWCFFIGAHLNNGYQATNKSIKGNPTIYIFYVICWNDQNVDYCLFYYVIFLLVTIFREIGAVLYWILFLNIDALILIEHALPVVHLPMTKRKGIIENTLFIT